MVAKLEWGHKITNQSMRFLCFLMSTFALLLPLSVFSQGAKDTAHLENLNPTPTSAMAIALDNAWQRHPQALALDAHDKAARSAIELADKLTPGPGAIAVSGRDDRVRGVQGRQEIEVELSVPLWLPKQRFARQAEANALANEALAKRHALRWQLAGEVRDAWWSLATARSAKIIAERRFATAQSLANEVQRRYKTGDVSRIELNLAQSETNNAQTELIESETSLQLSEQHFQSLTGTAAPFDLSEEQIDEKSQNQTTDFALQNQTAQGLDWATLEKNPQLVAAISAAHTAQARLKLAEHSSREAPEIALRAVRERELGSAPFSNGVGIQLKLPFSLGAQVQRDSALAQANLIETSTEVQRLRERNQAEAARIAQLLLRSEQLYKIARDNHALASDNQGLADKAFSLGEIDLAALLRIRAATFAAESSLERQRLHRASLISKRQQVRGILP